MPTPPEDGRRVGFAQQEQVVVAAEAMEAAGERAVERRAWMPREA